MSPVWEILIPTIPHRHEKLLTLLETLDEQMRPEVRVIVWRDNLEHLYRDKLQGLMDAATAPYVSTLADDDSVSPDFIVRCLAAMETGPDYVGFRVRYTLDGVVKQSVVHSLKCPEWTEGAAVIYRDLMYYNPIRRELAQQARFRGDDCDREWANDLRALGFVKKEVFIDAELLYYQNSVRDNFYMHREPYPRSWIKPLPTYPWLDVMK